MSYEWADKIAQKLISQGSMQKGICLVLGAADSGKTTLVAALVKHAVSTGPVGIIDADIGQSHIGPPAMVGWSVIKKPDVNFDRFAVGGISFVGDITPAGHLLQLTTAITQGIDCLAKETDMIVIDTPGFIIGQAASVLWWTIQRMVQPNLVLAVQRTDELNDILAGLKRFDFKLELVRCPSEIEIKSPQERRKYRQRQFSTYFQNSCIHKICLRNITIQTGWDPHRDDLVGRLVSLRNGRGIDMAIGLIEQWQNDKGIVLIRAPDIDINRVCCLVSGMFR